MAEEALRLAGLVLGAVLLRAGGNVETQDPLHLEGKLLGGEARGGGGEEVRKL